MGNNYYYTAAALPQLFLDREPPFSIEYFLDSCRSQLSEKDYNALLTATVDGETEPKPLLQSAHSFRCWTRGMKGRLAERRVERLNRKDLYTQREGDIEESSFAVVAEAEKIESPLEREKFLLSESWSFLENLRKGRIFDIEVIGIYYMQLQLLTRAVLFEKERGSTRFDEFYTESLNSAKELMTF